MTDRPKLNYTDIIKIAAEMDLGSRVENDAIKMNPEDYYNLKASTEAHTLHNGDGIMQFSGFRIVVDVDMPKGQVETCNYMEYMRKRSNKKGLEEAWYEATHRTDTTGFQEWLKEHLEE